MSGSPDIAVFEAYVREHNPLDEGVVRDRIVFGDTVSRGLMRFKGSRLR